MSSYWRTTGGCRLTVTASYWRTTGGCRLTVTAARDVAEIEGNRRSILVPVLVKTSADNDKNQTLVSLTNDN